MLRSKLQLVRHFFTKTSIEAQSDADPKAQNALRCQMEIGQIKDKERAYQVVFTMNLESDQNATTSYIGEVRIIGIFEVHKDVSTEEIDGLIEVNGVSMLFGAIREMVFNITARGPYQPVMLNTFAFSKISKSKPAQAETSSEGIIR